SASTHALTLAAPDIAPDGAVLDPDRSARPPQLASTHALTVAVPLVAGLVPGAVVDPAEAGWPPSSQVASTQALAPGPAGWPEPLAGLDPAGGWPPQVARTHAVTVAPGEGL